MTAGETTAMTTTTRPRLDAEIRATGATEGIVCIGKTQYAFVFNGGELQFVVDGALRSSLPGEDRFIHFTTDPLLVLPGGRRAQPCNEGAKVEGDAADGGQW